MQRPEQINAEPVTAPAARTTSAPTRGRLTRVLAPLLLLEFALWVYLVFSAGLFAQGPNGRTLGVDFAVFVSGAQVLKDGGNPYDIHVLFRTERGFLGRQGLAAPTDERLVRLANPPLFYWALQPLTNIPFRDAAMAWIAAMYALSAVGFLIALRYAGWTARLWPMAVFLFMPQTVLAATYGNVSGILMIAVTSSLLLARRYPVIAGAILSVGWLKPQITVPIALLILLFHAPFPRRVLAGIALGSAVLLAATIATTGIQSLSWWVGGIAGFSNGVALQPNYVSLAGLYTGWAPSWARLGLELLCLVAALWLTVLVWRAAATRRSIRNAPFLLWLVWFLAVPYAHFPDEILLALPVLVLLGCDGVGIRRAGGAVVLYLLFLSFLLFPSIAGRINLLCLPLLAIAVILFRDDRQVPSVA